MTSASKTRPRAFLVAVAFIGFISLALPDAALGVAWPFLRDDYLLPQAGLGLVLAGVAGGFFVSSFFAGRLLEAFGVGTLLAGSTVVVGLALAGFALSPSFLVVLVCAPLVGLGSGAIDSGLNAYAAKRFSARLMNWLHAAFGLGAALGPLVMTSAIVASGSWRVGYAALALFMAAMALLFASTRGAWRADAGGPVAPDGAAPVKITTADALRHRVVRLQFLIFVVYAGVEVGAGAWAFTVLSEGRGLSVELAGTMAGLYWGGLFVGRVGFGFVADRIGADRAVRLSFLAMVVAAGGFALLPTPLALVGLVLLGVACAPIFPTLMLRTPERLGDGLAVHAIGFQVSAAMLGGVIFPFAGGLVADAAGLLVVPYLFFAAALALVALNRLLERWTA